MSTLFIYSREGEKYKHHVLQNPLHRNVIPLAITDALTQPDKYFKDIDHVVIAAELFAIKSVLQHAVQFGFSVGFLPLENQKNLAKCYALPKKTDQLIQLALKEEPLPIDIITCNDVILLYRATIGTLPLFDDQSRKSLFRFSLSRMREIASLRLVPMTISTNGATPQKIQTAASCCMILASPAFGSFSNEYSLKSSFEDGMVSVMIIAPFSVVDYLRLIWNWIFLRWKDAGSPRSIGFVKAPEITIAPEIALPVIIDGEETTTTPVRICVSRIKVRINHGLPEHSPGKASVSNSEELSVQSLPSGKELQKARKRHLPIFAYASEERFKDLFIALREDARLNNSFIVLMVLSTILASVGLFLNSASVIIGAMVLAPLMAPIISMAMSILRYERLLFRQSLIKIGTGVFLALVTSFILTRISPYQPLTDEMSSRLNPTVLDLIVAVVAGIAGAYTKSFREILQSLAGVAIAVALVPPLAVAGIGLGRLDPVFFGQAFLLFSTNLIGIIFTATITFLVLGYSPVVRYKKGMVVIIIFFTLISIPLSMTFSEITRMAEFEESWKYERFLVNEKYLIVNQATLHEFSSHKLLILELHAREPLNRDDLNYFSQKLKRNFGEDVVIRAKVVYIP